MPENPTQYQVRIISGEFVVCTLNSFSPHAVIHDWNWAIQSYPDNDIDCLNQHGKHFSRDELVNLI